MEEEKRTEELDRSGLENRMFTAIAETSDRLYIYLCNMRTNVSRWCRNAVEYFGLPGEYMVDAGKIWEQCIHPDDREVYRQDIMEVFTGKKEYHSLEYRARNREGNYVVCTCRGRVLKGENGEPDLFAGTIINHGIVDNIDPITGLYNIYEFQNMIGQMCRDKEKALVLMVGVSYFKYTNDAYGYIFGNKTLQEFAEKLKEMVRGRGMAYRMDGVKFAVCIRGGDRRMAEELYIRIKTIASKQIQVENISVPLEIAGGAVLLDNYSLGEYPVRACAAQALEESKKTYHGELVFFDGELMNQKYNFFDIINTLRINVLKKDCEGFYMCYQPLVRAEDEKVIGMEALVRWHGEPFGEVPPGRFIPWLENDSCFFELGNWILRQSLLDARALVEKNPEFVVNVNISYTQLERQQLRDAVMDILRETGFPPENLCLELTERCRMLDIDFLRGELEFFRAQGIRIALDDFGTGNSSLGLLRELPVTSLKVDRAFIADIQKNVTDQAIVEAVIQCADRMGVDVCMEGIEDKESREFLLRYGAYMHQGYYYAKPMRIERFEEQF